MDLALKLLQKHWKHKEFRPLQKSIIDAVLNKQDVLTILPTGGGKSVCYQIPGIINKGVCIVISPLLALMEDQVKELLNKGVKATYLKSGISEDEIITLFDNIRFGNYKFLYLSPERLQSKFIQNKLKQLDISFFAIDEAHCISEWGHDFRSSYRKLSLIKQLFEKTPIIALTATARKKVIDDIKTNLLLDNPKVFKEQLERTNLFFQVLKTENKLHKLKEIISKVDGTTIVYVNSRKKSQELSSFLNNMQIPSTFYHAGLLASEKENNFEIWNSEKAKVIVATNAFGMGINKNNVRLVIHYSLPNSIEEYMQQSGRAGRDQKKAFCIVLTNTNEIELKKAILKKQTPDLKEIKEIHKKIYQYFQIGLGEVSDEKLHFDLEEFSDKYKFQKIKVFHTLNLLESFGILTQTKNSKKSSLKLSKNILSTSLKKHKQKNIIEFVLRNYSGAIENEIYINDFFLAKKNNIHSQDLIYELEDLQKQGLLEYKKSSNLNLININLPREDDRSINIISRDITNYQKNKETKLNYLLRYIDNNETCRSIQILNYFDETNTKKCLNCDNCLTKQKTDSKVIQKEIQLALQTHSYLNSQKLCELLNFPEKEILVNLQILLAEEKINNDNFHNYYLKKDE